MGTGEAGRTTMGGGPRSGAAGRAAARGGGSARLADTGSGRKNNGVFVGPERWRSALEQTALRAPPAHPDTAPAHALFRGQRTPRRRQRTRPPPPSASPHADGPPAHDAVTPAIGAPPAQSPSLPPVVAARRPLPPPPRAWCGGCVGAAAAAFRQGGGYTIMPLAGGGGGRDRIIAWKGHVVSFWRRGGMISAVGGG